MSERARSDYVNAWKPSQRSNESDPEGREWNEAVLTYMGTQTESERDERFETIRSFVIGEDGYVETAASLEALASIQAELSALREAWDAWAEHSARRHGCDWGYTERPAAASGETTQEP